MRNCARDGTDLVSLVRQAKPFCREAERLCPRTGPGRKPEIPDWTMAVLIVVAVLKLRKTKSSQYRFLRSHRRELAAMLGTTRFPARSTYFQRYRRAWKLYEVAIRLAGRFAIDRRQTQARCVAVDKSVIARVAQVARQPGFTRGVCKNELPDFVAATDGSFAESERWIARSRRYISMTAIGFQHRATHTMTRSS
jgi:hypothetical protein